MSLLLAPTLAVLLLGVGVFPMAAAASGSYETRAEFVQSLDVALGVQPVYPATPDFTDVPSSSSYYGYIEAAYQSGWINGVGSGMFDPSGLLTRAQVAKIEVLALGLGSAASALSSQTSTFTDASQIPTWAVGYVNEAVAVGILKGEPGGIFDPQGNLTTAQEAFVLSQLLAYKTSQQTISATGLQVSAPAQATAGVPFSLTLSVQGDPTYAGTDALLVALQQPDPGATLPATAIFANGTATIMLTLTTAQPNTITITDQTLNLQASMSLTVQPSNVVSGLVVSTPASATVGVPFNATLTLQDAYRNTVAFTGSASLIVTLSADPNAVVPSTTIFQNGIASIAVTPSVAGDNALMVTSFADGAMVTDASQPIAVQMPATATITFNANGGSGYMPSETEAIGTSASLSANTFTRAGYSFSGWNTAANGGGTPFSDGELVQFTGSTTLFAQWTIASTSISFTGTTSSNWSGYVLPSGSAIFTDVSAQWTVPILNCADTPNSNASTWVGIGGWPWSNGGTSGTLLQTGITDNCVNGAQQDYGWFEEYPSSPNNQQAFSNFPVSPGDSILAEVYQTTSGQWVTVVQDLTTGLQGVMGTGIGWDVETIANNTLIGSIQGDATGLSYSGGYTAEWIQEDTTNATTGSLLPLANFGTVTFTNLRTSLPSGWLLPNSDSVELVNSNGTPLSVPSPISGGGFTVTYTGP